MTSLAMLLYDTNSILLPFARRCQCQVHSQDHGGDVTVYPLELYSSCVPVGLIPREYDCSSTRSLEPKPSCAFESTLIRTIYGLAYSVTLCQNLTSLVRPPLPNCYNVRLLWHLVRPTAQPPGARMPSMSCLLAHIVTRDPPEKEIFPSALTRQQWLVPLFQIRTTYLEVKCQAV